MSKDIELEDLFEKLIFMEKVEKGLNQIKQGLTIPHEEVKLIVRQW